MATIYQKLAKARAELKAAGLKMSGKNKGVGYTYFDLSDLLPAITKIELENGILSVVRYEAERATLTVYNGENPEEFIEFASPMSTAELRGCHPVQNLGAAETYIRRYLYLAAYEVVETEQLDLTQGEDNQSGGIKKPEPKKPTPKKTTEPKEAPPTTPTPRKRLIAKLRELGLDIEEFAKAYEVTTETTDERFEELIAKLEKMESGEVEHDD